MLCPNCRGSGLKLGFGNILVKCDCPNKEQPAIKNNTVAQEENSSDHKKTTKKKLRKVKHPLTNYRPDQDPAIIEASETVDIPVIAHK